LQAVKRRDFTPGLFKPAAKGQIGQQGDTTRREELRGFWTGLAACKHNNANSLPLASFYSTPVFLRRGWWVTTGIFGFMPGIKIPKQSG
jgi:hypothetical protein